MNNSQRRDDHIKFLFLLFNPLAAKEMSGMQQLDERKNDRRRKNITPKQQQQQRKHTHTSSKTFHLGQNWQVQTPNSSLLSQFQPRRSWQSWNTEQSELQWTE
jgi:hypothetical protein